MTPVIETLQSRFKYSLLSQVMSMLSGTVLLLSLTRVLSSANFGLFYLSLSVLGMVQLLAKFGIPNSAARFISEYKETDPGQLRYIINFSLLLNATTIFLAMSLLFVGSDVIADLASEQALSRILSYGALYVGAASFGNYTILITQGLEDIEISSLLQVLRDLSKLAFTLVFVLLGTGAVGALMGYTIGYLLSSIVGLWYIYAKIRKVDDKSDIEPQLRQRIARYSLPLASTSAAHSLDDRFDTILIGFILGPIAVGYYTVAKRVIKVVEVPISAVGFAIAPSYEAERAKGKKENSARIFEETFANGLLLYIPAAMGVFYTAEPLIKIAFGNSYSPAASVLKILSIYVVFRCVTQVCSSGIDYLGRGKDRAIALCCTALLNVILNIVLIPEFGAAGAAVATSFTYGIYAILNVYIVNTELKLGKEKLLERLLQTCVITVLVTIPVHLFADQITGLFTLFSLVVGTVLLWSLLVSLFGIVKIRDYTP